jgi:hypothetical protein
MKVKLSLAMCGAVLMTALSIYQITRNYSLHQYWHMALDLPGVLVGVWIARLALARIKSTL